MVGFSSVVQVNKKEMDVLAIPCTFTWALESWMQWATKSAMRELLKVRVYYQAHDSESVALILTHISSWPDVMESLASDLLAWLGSITVALAQLSGA